MQKVCAASEAYTEGLVGVGCPVWQPTDVVQVVLPQWVDGLAQGWRWRLG